MFVATAGRKHACRRWARRRYRELRPEPAGTTVNWAFNGDYARRDDMHFNGTSWAIGVDGWQNTQTPRDDKATSASTYCGASVQQQHAHQHRRFGPEHRQPGRHHAQLALLLVATPSYTKLGHSSADGTDKLVLGAAIAPDRLQIVLLRPGHRGRAAGL